MKLSIRILIFILILSISPRLTADTVHTKKISQKRDIALNATTPLNISSEVQKKPESLEINLVGWGIAVLALFLSIINFWYTFLLKGHPIFVCTRWTAVQMQANDEPHASFAVQISVYNKGKVPLQLFDFVLQAISDDNQVISYEAIVLWDLRQWIEDGNRPDKIGRTQKGQVPLPLIISPGQYYDFNYPILFLPIDKASLINPKTANSVFLKVFARTDRSKDYKVIGTQKFSSDDLKSIMTKAFVSVVSSESIANRHELLINMND